MTVTAVIGSVDRDAKEGGNVRRIEVERVVVHHKYVEYYKQEFEDKKRLDSKLNDNSWNGSSVEGISTTSLWLKSRNTNMSIKWVTDAKSYVYNNKNYYDIALLKLKDRIVPVFNETHYIINSICLPKTGIVNKEHENVMIIGMGVTEQTIIPTHPY